MIDPYSFFKTKIINFAYSSKLCTMEYNYALVTLGVTTIVSLSSSSKVLVSCLPHQLSVTPVIQSPSAEYSKQNIYGISQPSRRVTTACYAHTTVSFSPVTLHSVTECVTTSGSVITNSRGKDSHETGKDVCTISGMKTCTSLNLFT